uniref:Uncharacterized protein n=1 Tax=Rhizophora mucronata TaxID=61149 RepID=A0A2P2KND4_RHIMU
MPQSIDCTYQYYTMAALLRTSKTQFYRNFKLWSSWTILAAYFGPLHKLNGKEQY